MKNSILIVAFLFLLSCDSDTYQSEEVEGVGLISISQCSNSYYNPLFVVEKSDIIDFNDLTLDGPVYCNNYSGYVTSNIITDYDRLVTVFYSYTDKDPNKTSYNGIRATEVYRIKANSNKSDKRPILQGYLFEARGSVEARIANVKRALDGTLITCYEGRKTKVDFINCFKEPRFPYIPKPVELKLSDNK